MVQKGWTLDEYRTAGGTSLVEAFLEGLSNDAYAEAVALIKLLAEFGDRLRFPRSQPLGEGIFELRGKRHGVRMFYVFRPGHRIVLLDGIVKKRDKIPSAVLKRVRGLRQDLLKREEE